jgi:hypothetical protein
MVKLITLLRGLKYKFCTLYNAKERFAQSQIILQLPPCGWQTCPNGNCCLFANLLHKYIKVLTFFWISQTVLMFQFYLLNLCIIYMVFRELVLLLDQGLYKSQTPDRPGIALSMLFLLHRKNVCHSSNEASRRYQIAGSYSSLQNYVP